MNDFELFKSNICQLIKNQNAERIINKIIVDQSIETYFEKQEYDKSLYLLGIVDYLTNKFKLQTRHELDKYRTYKLNEMLYPRSVELIFILTKDDALKKKALANAIPEFLKYNIIEGEIENVY